MLSSVYDPVRESLPAGAHVLGPAQLEQYLELEALGMFGQVSSELAQSRQRIAEVLQEPRPITLNNRHIRDVFDEHLTAFRAQALPEVCGPDANYETIAEAVAFEVDSVAAKGLMEKFNQERVSVPNNEVIGDLVWGSLNSTRRLWKLRPHSTEMAPFRDRTRHVIAARVALAQGLLAVKVL